MNNNNINNINTNDMEEAKVFFKGKVNTLNEINRVFQMNNSEFNEWHNNKVIENLKYVKNNSRYYKEKLKDINIDNIKDKDKVDMSFIPFTTKSEIKEQYPFGLIASPMEEIVRYGESSGTTSEPINSYYTREDWVKNNCIVAKCLSSILKKEDIVAVIVPYELALVGQDLDRALEIIGCTTIAIGSLTKFCSEDKLIKILKSTKATTLICAPSRALYIADIIKKRNMDPIKDFNISKILCVGEGTSAEKYNVLSNIFKAQIYPMYGMTETNTLAMSCECGELHLVENKAYFEIVDPITNEILPDGKKGELVVTSFMKGMPLVRYKTGDLCTIDTSKCKCESIFRVLKHHGRIQDNVIIGNKSIQIIDLENIILKNTSSMFYTLRVCENSELEIGLVLSQDEVDKCKETLKNSVKEKYEISVHVVRTSNEKMKNVIYSHVKPSVKSVVIE